MQLFVSIVPPEETLGYLENCIAELSHLNKRLPIKWYDRTLLVSHLIELPETEKGSLPTLCGIVDEVSSQQEIFYIGLANPELVFKNERPTAVHMKLFEQSGSLATFQNALGERISSVFKEGVSKKEPAIILGKVASGKKPKRKIRIDIGHIDSVFPIQKVSILERRLTSIGPLLESIHFSKVGNE